MLNFAKCNQASSDDSRKNNSGLINATRRDVIKGLAMAAVAGGMARTASGEPVAGSGYPTPRPRCGRTIGHEIQSLVVYRSKSTLTDLRTSFLAFATVQSRPRSPVQSFNPMPPSIGKKMASVISSAKFH